MLFADPAVRCWSPAEAAVTHVRLVPSADSVQVLAVHGPHVSVSTPFQPTHRTAEQVERAEANPPSTSRLWSDWGGNAREHWSKRVTCLTVMRSAEDSLGVVSQAVRTTPFVCTVRLCVSTRPAGVPSAAVRRRR